MLVSSLVSQLHQGLVNSISNEISKCSNVSLAAQERRKKKNKYREIEKD